MAKRRKNPAAVALGRLGGLASGGKALKARLEKMTPAERSKLARRAVLKRWARTTLAERRAHSRKMQRARKRKGKGK